MLNLKQCDHSCLGCVKGYKDKFLAEAQSLGEKLSFTISCEGIPSNYVDERMSAQLPDLEHKEILMLLDPVTWAAENLDWHCLDPDGSIWKEKNPKEWYDWIVAHPGEDILGKSRYHRPYQSEMLRCTSRKKVFRCGRQLGKTDCIVVSMLYHLVVRPGLADNEGFKIVLITPYQSQIDLVFKRLNQLLSASKTLRGCIFRSVKAPQYCLELNNGSMITGFTAGTKSGTGAASARGQSAHMLVFDEADYLAADDMDAAMSIVTNFPQCKIWMSSTPVGHREKFYEVCKDRDWKEFYFPSWINPLWSKDLENTFRKTLTAVGWEHEIVAAFGESEQGVFQNAYIEAARAPYSYGDMGPSPDWVYTMGVDWNDTKNGTTIAIIGLNKNTGLYYVADSRVVQREGWTQLKACEEIIKLNRFWRPSYLYFDQGHGGTQIELLKKTGYEAIQDKARGPRHPDAKLIKIKAFDFGSKIELKDIFTHQPIFKWAKGFLVENAVRFFENGIIRFASADDALKKQLEGYYIDRSSDMGRCVFKPGPAGDHILDAVMLGLVAFALELSVLGKPQFSTEVAFTAPLGVSALAEGVATSSVGAVKTQEDRRPDMQRWTDEKTLPGVRKGNKEKEKVWAWDGFSRDEPKPQSLGSNSSKKSVLYRMSRPEKPRRRNI
jgi:hypothetical protein